MQTVRRRVVLASIVLTVGILAAIPFYRPAPASNAEPSRDESDRTVPVSTLGTARLQVPSGEPAESALSSLEASRVSSQTNHESVSEPATKQSPSPPPPELPTRRPSAREMVPAATAIRRVAGDPPSNNVSDSQDTPAQNPIRTHRIIDGDTLEDLAKRFLGDRTRWRDILDGNRDVLTSEDILPIGKRIKIPPRGVQTAPATSPSAVEDHNLVPIPWQSK